MDCFQTQENKTRASQDDDKTSRCYKTDFRRPSVKSEIGQAERGAAWRALPGVVL